MRLADRLGIRTQILVPLVAATLLGVGLITYFTIGILTDRMEFQLHQELVSVARTVQAMADSQNSRMRMEVEALATFEAPALVAPSTPQASEDAEARILAQEASHGVSTIQILDQSGKRLLSAGPSFTAGQELLDMAAAGTVVTCVASGNALWHVAASPVTAPGGGQMFVVIGMPLDRVYLNELAGTTGAEIALSSGDVVAGSSHLVEQLLVERGRSSSGQVAGAQYNTGANGNSYAAYDTVLEFSPLHRTSALILLPRDMVIAATQHSATQVIRIGVIFAVLLTGLLLWLARRITDPLRKLAMQSSKIAQGRYGGKVEIAGANELRQLARSFNEMSEELDLNAQRLKEMTYTDSLTGLLNHHRLHELLDEEITRARRYNHSVAIIMAELDHFKLLNDTYGHPIGDEVLLAVTALLKNTCRTTDIIGRYGGDEFMLLLPETETDQAEVVAMRIQESLARHQFHVGHGGAIPVTMSIGIAMFPYDSSLRSSLIATANAALYESKNAGGNRVTMAGPVDDDAVSTATTTFTTLQGLVTAVDNKDHYTRSHSDTVTRYALMMADELRLAADARTLLQSAAQLHDIGKIGIPDRILRKPGPLDPEEYEIMKQHTVLGEMIVKEVPHLAPVQEAILHHHERYDGAGYPRGLSGEQIPLLARLLAVVDAYSAMTSDRPYRKGMSSDQAVTELKRVAGTQLDPNLVVLFISRIEEEATVA